MFVQICFGYSHASGIPAGSKSPPGGNLVDGSPPIASSQSAAFGPFRAGGVRPILRKQSDFAILGVISSQKRYFSANFIVFGSMMGTLVPPKPIENKFSRESGENKSIRHKKLLKAAL